MDESKVEYGPRMLEAYLATLEAELPLRYRELVIEGTNPQPVGATVQVCGDGHVHLFFGPMTSLGTMLIDGILAYTMALILDTKPTTPKRPGRKVVHDRVSRVQRVLANLDLPIGMMFVENLGTLRDWLDDYTKSAAGSALFPAPRGREKAPEPEPESEHPPTLVSPETDRRALDGVDLGTSQMLTNPFGYSQMFGVLALPFDVGKA